MSFVFDTHPLEGASVDWLAEAATSYSEAKAEVTQAKAEVQRWTTARNHNPNSDKMQAVLEKAEAKLAEAKLCEEEAK